MELVEVEITGMVMTAQYGTLNTGAILRTDAAFAKHLVEDCSAAKYRQANQVAIKPVQKPTPNRSKKPPVPTSTAPEKAAEGQGDDDGESEEEKAQEPPI